MNKISAQVGTPRGKKKRMNSNTPGKCGFKLSVEKHSYTEEGKAHRKDFSYQRQSLTREGEQPPERQTSSQCSLTRSPGREKDPRQKHRYDGGCHSLTFGTRVPRRFAQNKNSGDLRINVSSFFKWQSLFFLCLFLWFYFWDNNHWFILTDTKDRWGGISFWPMANGNNYRDPDCEMSQQLEFSLAGRSPAGCGTPGPAGSSTGLDHGYCGTSGCCASQANYPQLYLPDIHVDNLSSHACHSAEGVALL